ncbi:hypothetical protein EYF80_038228 [Liparis tanakae]|uniref:Uncharacterized protein n=1 Tax=Liparis tanakae TaxID=230148 RepID=A0A4Z2GE05_9TELE|nr:hypothetical protein EYF80_038228 [Liparis tanakae]
MAAGERGPVLPRLGRRPRFILAAQCSPAPPPTPPAPPPPSSGPPGPPTPSDGPSPTPLPQGGQRPNNTPSGGNWAAAGASLTVRGVINERKGEKDTQTAGERATVPRGRVL